MSQLRPIPASEGQFHIVNFVSGASNRPHLRTCQWATVRKKYTCIALTEPLVQLMYPSLTGIFNWRIEENDLILYPDLMHNRFESHIPF